MTTTSSCTPLNTDANPANRDPITGTPGAHPVGTGLGAVGGGAAGAAIGAIGGPVGAVAGAVVGAVAGGLGGKAAAEAIDPTVQDVYWEKNFKTRPYAGTGEYRNFRPAYRYGWESTSRYPGKSFDEAAPHLERDWSKSRAESNLSWEQAKPATRDAWDRITSRAV
jgi:hypothetical protein